MLAEIEPVQNSDPRRKPLVRGDAPAFGEIKFIQVDF